MKQESKLGITDHLKVRGEERRGEEEDTITVYDEYRRIFSAVVHVVPLDIRRHLTKIHNESLIWSD